MNLSHGRCIGCCNTTPMQTGHCSSSMADSSCVGARLGYLDFVLSCEALINSTNFSCSYVVVNVNSKFGAAHRVSVHNPHNNSRIIEIV